MRGILWAVLVQPEQLEIDRRYPCGDPHHITLKYDVELGRIEALNCLGTEFDAIVWAEAANNRIQALQVKVPGFIPSENPFPHITVSYIEGVEPCESNQMLADYASNPALKAMAEARGQIRFFDKSRIVKCRIEFQEFPPTETNAIEFQTDICS
jgi:hypothetical protein